MDFSKGLYGMSMGSPSATCTQPSGQTHDCMMWAGGFRVGNPAGLQVYFGTM